MAPNVSESIEFGKGLQSPSNNEAINNLVGSPVLSDNDQCLSADELVENGFKKNAAIRFITQYRSLLKGRSLGGSDNVAFLEGLKAFVADTNNIAPQDPYPWHALLEKGQKVWRATDPALRAQGIDHIQAGKGTRGSAFTDFEIYDAKGGRIAQFLVANPLKKGQFEINLDPNRKCSESESKADQCHLKRGHQPDLAEINEDFAKTHPECAESVAAYAASYSCSTAGDPLCIGPTLLYSEHTLQGTYGIDGLAFLNGRMEGAYNADLGGYILFDKKSGDFEIFPRTTVIVDKASYDLTDEGIRKQFETKMAASTHLSGFQSIRLVDDDQKENGWKGAPYGAGQNAATRRAIGHLGWLSSSGEVKKASAMLTIEQIWDMREGGKFLNQLGVVEAIATNTGGWGAGFMVRKNGQMDTSLPPDPARRIDPESHKGTGWYEAGHYVMTVHACVSKK